MASASHPHGLNAGNAKISEAIDDANNKLHAGQPEWLRDVFQAFE